MVYRDYPVRSVNSSERDEGDFTDDAGVLSILPSSESRLVAMAFWVRHLDTSTGIERDAPRAVVTP